MKTTLFSFFSLFFLVFLTACATKEAPRGNLLLPDKVEQVKGAQTKADIIEIAGTPSAVSLFGEETWYYIGYHQTQWAFLRPKQTEQQIIAITFFDDQINQMKFLDLQDQKQIAFAEKTTPVLGDQPFNLFKELFGNIGRFTPGHDL